MVLSGVGFPSSIKSIEDLKYSGEITMKATILRNSLVKFSSLFEFNKGKRKQLKLHSRERAVTKH